MKIRKKNKKNDIFIYIIFLFKNKIKIIIIKWKIIENNVEKIVLTVCNQFT